MIIKSGLFGSLAVSLAREEQGNLIDSPTKSLYMGKRQLSNRKLEREFPKGGRDRKWVVSRRKKFTKASQRAIAFKNIQGSHSGLKE